LGGRPTEGNAGRHRYYTNRVSQCSPRSPTFTPANNKSSHLLPHPHRLFPILHRAYCFLFLLRREKERKEKRKRRKKEEKKEKREAQIFRFARTPWLSGVAWRSRLEAASASDMGFTRKVSEWFTDLWICSCSGYINLIGRVSSNLGSHRVELESSRRSVAADVVPKGCFITKRLDGAG